MFNKGNTANIYFLLGDRELERLNQIESEIEWLRKMEVKTMDTSPKKSGLYRKSRSALQWALSYIIEHQKSILDSTPPVVQEMKAQSVCNMTFIQGSYDFTHTRCPNCRNLCVSHDYPPPATDEKRHKQE